MLQLRRRHLASCPHKDMKYLRCKCPLWVYGSADGRRIRRSLDTSSMKIAEDRIREMEALRPTITVKEASERWLRDCNARKLTDNTLRKYRPLVKELQKRFAKVPVNKITVADIRMMRESWKLASNTTVNRLQTLRGFFNFCIDSDWTDANPASRVKPPKADMMPTLPFSQRELEKIMWALEVYPEKHPQSPPDTRRKLKAMILLLRYSGIRISDAVMLTSDRIENGRLFLYQAKTKVPVQIPLPKEVLDALSECEEPSGKYFWPGGKLKTWTTEWQERLKKVFKIAGIPDGHAHRFRDTFSVELLEKGVSLETVSLLLGHKSIKTTEKHYAPYVHSRQVALEKEVMKAWSAAIPGKS